MAAEKDNDPNYIVDMKKSMLADLDNRYQDERIKSILAIACFLDPRFKSHVSSHTKHKLIELTEELNESTMGPDSESMNLVPNTLSQDLSMISMFPPVATSTPIPSKNGQSIENDIYMDSDSDSEDEHLLITLHQKIVSEVTIYDVQPAIPKDQQKFYDPLKWWKHHESMFPLLTKTFKILFCIPATSVPSERAFSMANNIVTQKITRLTPTNVEIIGFLKHNYDYIPKDYTSTINSKPFQSIMIETDSDFDD